MNLCSEFEILKAWKTCGLSRLTLTLTPALSPGKREDLFPRIGNMLALDLTRFRGSMRERAWKKKRRQAVAAPMKRSQRFAEVQRGVVGG
jgi:hypothetical protein